MPLDSQTIVAISSAVAQSARIIVRLSGNHAYTCLSKLKFASPIEPPFALRANFELSPGIVVPGWVYAFAAPRSYTGEDLVELHLPGNPLLAKMAMQRCMEVGARLAEPGEFTARAFFHGKLDLAQAEGVALAVSAQSQGQLDAAKRLMQGELSRRLAPLMDACANLLALIEAEIDFSDQDVSFIEPPILAAKIEAIVGALRELLRQSDRFNASGQEPMVVFAGPPNAGKSTMLNAMCGYARAVASPTAGTTRDVISERVALRRGYVQIHDSAGIEPKSSRAEEADSLGDIGRQMERQTLDAIAQATVLVWVCDSSDPIIAHDLPRPADLVVRNKCDLASGQCEPSGESQVWVSALKRTNLDVLREKLDSLAFGKAEQAWTLVLNDRHEAAIGQAVEFLDHARSNADAGVELIAADLRAALDALGQVLGVIAPDDILGRIFSTFCIGK